jgi:mono/diheme cytochrome c family protein
MSTRTSSWLLAGAVAAASLFAIAGCSEKKFKGAMILGGVKVSSSTLEHGEEVYTHFCRPCHGDEGDGRGASASSLRPPPRDFRQGMFKFGSVTTGLPNDEDFHRIIRFGLKGTAMLPWDLADEDLDAVIQYIKTFSPRWQPAQMDPKTKKLAGGFKQGDKIAPSKPDPWMDPSREAEGVDRGKYLFHVKAQCGSCHPNYVTRQELSDMNIKASGAPLTEFRDDMYGSVLKESQYKLGAAADGTGGYFLKLLPPDFTRVDTRSIRVQLGKVTAVEDLYRVIGGGINGTPMPAWKGTVFEQGHDADDDLWALAHYVYALINMKGTPAAVELQMKLANQPPFVPPPPAPEPTTDGAATGDGAPSPEGSASAAPDASASAAPAPSTSAAPTPSTSAAKPAGGAKPKPKTK